MTSIWLKTTFVSQWWKFHSDRTRIKSLFIRRLKNIGMVCEKLSKHLKRTIKRSFNVKFELQLNGQRILRKKILQKADENNDCYWDFLATFFQKNKKNEDGIHLLRDIIYVKRILLHSLFSIFWSCAMYRYIFSYFPTLQNSYCIAVMFS